MPRRLAALARRLQHTELDLKLGRVPAEGLERLPHLLALVAVGGARQVLDLRQRRQRRSLRRSLEILGCHALPRLLTRPRKLTSMTPVPDCAQESYCGSTCIPSSARTSFAIGVGAPVIGSEPEAVFGKATTSRMFCSPASSATKRSIPIAKPPCGGAPIRSTSSRKPNRSSDSCSSIPIALKTRRW